MGKVELLVAETSYLKLIKSSLEANGAFVKPIHFEDGCKIVRTAYDMDDARVQEILETYKGVKAREYTVQEAAIFDRVSRFTDEYLTKNGISAADRVELAAHIPLRYTLYHPVVLFNNSAERSFLHASWQNVLQKPENSQFFKLMLQELFPQYTHAATNMPIVEHDVMRRPFHLVPLEGCLFEGEACEQTWDEPTPRDFTRSVWCHVVQNGIHQFWSPVFTMFSRGNIKEKKRILDTYPDIGGRDIVDLYAGIGYFTLSYLKAGARRVFCFELNPWSTEGLRRGVAFNNFRGECHVFQESNVNCIARLAQFQNLEIRHINLGLLPSSAQGYPLALSLVRDRSALSLTTLHIHENVHLDSLTSGQFTEQTVNHLQEIEPLFQYRARHLEKIKTFAPDVWHVCLDVDVHVPGR
ncbi:tRNA(Phe) (4-demethylwyosine(37)-C(7)) aminocarboxypropyltransferase [Lachancea thermotolerans CBS 6340]|uniref:tRNA wybutosine-synthesizing protein 2 n=1 Tax=Lachancea thermotolerans (strain ATCC 56472 / CBS 6340 / NRRL Y-8284) TaxID=559295 RepID=C5DMQ4_LACTC|nr:KLTH0G10780p [Lachancea thermotolerans CBS 6340]CAR25065.1 KLTH0G10780p [Lachancea thermotolerans CBS 6340]